MIKLLLAATFASRNLLVFTVLSAYSLIYLPYPAHLFCLLAVAIRIATFLRHYPASGVPTKCNAASLKSVHEYSWICLGSC